MGDNGRSGSPGLPCLCFNPEASSRPSSIQKQPCGESSSVGRLAAISRTVTTISRNMDGAGCVLGSGLQTVESLS